MRNCGLRGKLPFSCPALMKIKKKGELLCMAFMKIKAIADLHLILLVVPWSGNTF